MPVLLCASLLFLFLVDFDPLDVCFLEVCQGRWQCSAQVWMKWWRGERTCEQKKAAVKDTGCCYTGWSCLCRGRVWTVAVLFLSASRPTVKKCCRCKLFAWSGVKKPYSLFIWLGFCLLQYICSMMPSVEAEWHCTLYGVECRIRFWCSCFY